MKVVQVCPYPFPSLGGPARSYLHFNRIADMATIGFVRARHAAQETPIVPLTVTVKVHDFSRLGYYHYATRDRLQEAEQLVAAADCVFIHGFFLFPEIWLMRTCRRFGVPYVIVPHGIFDPWAMRKNGLLKNLWMARYGNRILSGAARVLFATAQERTKARSVPSRVPSSVIKWAVEVPELAAARRRRSEIRAKLGFADDDRVLLFFGRLHSMKRPRETVRWLAKLAVKHVKLLVVGPEGDVTEAQLHAEAKAAGWPGLRTVGAVWNDEKYAYLCAADAYISLSYRENFNYTLGEAMAAGLPPILSAGNDLGLEFEPQGFSWQLANDDPASLLTAVDEFAALPEKALRARGALAQGWAEQHLSLRRFDAELAQLLEEIVPRKKVATV